MGAGRLFFVGGWEVFSPFRDGSADLCQCRNSAGFSAMLSCNLVFEFIGIECARFAAFFAFDQLRSDRGNIELSGLSPADQVANVLTVTGKTARIDLGLDPGILLFGQGDGLPWGAQLYLRRMR